MNVTNTIPSERLPALLGKQFLFAQCPTTILESLALFASVMHLGDGDVLFKRGESCETLFLLAKGRVKLLLPTTSKQTGRAISVGQQGHCLNAPSLFLDPMEHLWGAQSQGESMVITVPQNKITPIMATTPTVRLRVMGDISAQLMHIVRFKTGFLPKCASRRVMEYILDLVPESAVRDDAIVVLPSLKQEIAATLLLEPATLSRTLNQLQERGLIAVRHRQIKIPSLRNFRQQMNDWEQRITRCAQGGSGDEDFAVAAPYPIPS